MGRRPGLEQIALRVSLAALFALSPTSVGQAASRVKLRGYITARPKEQSIQILDDLIHFGPATRLELQNSPGDKSFTEKDLEVGLLIEAEGTWAGRHQIFAEKITCDASQFDKEIKESAYLEQEPKEADKIAGSLPARLKADGELLILDEKTQRAWAAAARPAQESGLTMAAAEPQEKAPSDVRLAGHQVHYKGVRRPDGTIAATRVELGPPAPPDAYKMPHGISVVAGKDTQTGIDVLEFRRGSKVDGRLKLFPVRAVQEYVARLGDSLLPPAAAGTRQPIEFRFFVVEDPEINAEALPDGTVLVNTGLLGAAENEAQLAFVLSHEIAHVLQVHQWREVHETRPKRMGLLLAGLAAGAFIGNLGLFLSELGMAAVVNGHERRLENQADRLGMQNIIEHGYDPHQASGLSRIIIEHYGNRSTSRIWSNHDSSVLRGSFLTVQLARQYPQGHFDQATVDTDAFRAMREAMGPVKIL